MKSMPKSQNGIAFIPIIIGSVIIIGIIIIAAAADNTQKSLQKGYEEGQKAAKNQSGQESNTSPSPTPSPTPIPTPIPKSQVTPKPITATSTPKPTQTPTSTKPREVSELGKEAFLRLPDNTDPKQLIPLAPTKEISGQVTKTLIAKDWQGLLELMTNEGVFSVPNGTKALLIDKAIGLRKVRVLEGEMQSKAGWLPMEWVVDR